MLLGKHKKMKAKFRGWDKKEKKMVELGNLDELIK